MNLNWRRLRTDWATICASRLSRHRLRLLLLQLHSVLLPELVSGLSGTGARAGYQIDEHDYRDPVDCRLCRPALGGWISDKIFNITGRLLLSRKIVLVVALLAAALCVALAGTVEGVTSAVLLMSISIFFLYITGAIYWAIIQDVVHKSRVGGISGFIHLVGSVSGIIGPIVTGFIVQHTGKFDSAFVLAGVIAALGAFWCCSW